MAELAAVQAGFDVEKPLSSGCQEANGGLEPASASDEGRELESPCFWGWRKQLGLSLVLGLVGAGTYTTMQRNGGSDSAHAPFKSIAIADEPAGSSGGERVLGSENPTCASQCYQWAYHWGIVCEFDGKDYDWSPDCTGCRECADYIPRTTPEILPADCAAKCYTGPYKFDYSCEWNQACSGCDECQPTTAPTTTVDPTMICEDSCHNFAYHWGIVCQFTGEGVEPACTGCSECASYTPQTPPETLPADCAAKCYTGPYKVEYECEVDLACSGCEECKA
eukprot:TRINITY_DN1829_c0_g1_i11.p1 TRINITY_DN1829_c0_g1~~TRINITY_DN1829_c0_g1_i11.p1  ORF type:complete len:279 (-),score=14.26 TRINITY_DN1829_c0_g1_i11:353-1189(-)